MSNNYLQTILSAYDGRASVPSAAAVCAIAHKAAAPLGVPADVAGGAEKTGMSAIADIWNRGDKFAHGAMPPGASPIGDAPRSAAADPPIAAANGPPIPVAAHVRRPAGDRRKGTLAELVAEYSSAQIQNAQRAIRLGALSQAWIDGQPEARAGRAARSSGGGPRDPTGAWRGPRRSPRLQRQPPDCRGGPGQTFRRPAGGSCLVCRPPRNDPAHRARPAHRSLAGRARNCGRGEAVVGPRPGGAHAGGAGPPRGPQNRAPEEIATAAAAQRMPRGRMLSLAERLTRDDRLALIKILEAANAAEVQPVAA